MDRPGRRSHGGQHLRLRHPHLEGHVVRLRRVPLPRPGSARGAGLIDDYNSHLSILMLGLYRGLVEIVRVQLPPVPGGEDARRRPGPDCLLREQPASPHRSACGAHDPSLALAGRCERLPRRAEPPVGGPGGDRLRGRTQPRSASRRIACRLAHVRARIDQLWDRGGRGMPGAQPGLRSMVAPMGGHRAPARRLAAVVGRLLGPASPGDLRTTQPWVCAAGIRVGPRVQGL